MVRCSKKVMNALVWFGDSQKYIWTTSHFSSLHSVSSGIQQWIGVRKCTFSVLFEFEFKFSWVWFFLRPMHNVQAMPSLCTLCQTSPSTVLGVSNCAKWALCTMYILCPPCPMKTLAQLSPLLHAPLSPYTTPNLPWPFKGPLWIHFWPLIKPPANPVTKCIASWLSPVVTQNTDQVYDKYESDEKSQDDNINGFSNDGGIFSSIGLKGISECIQGVSQDPNILAMSECSSIICTMVEAYYSHTMYSYANTYT